MSFGGLILAMAGVQAVTQIAQSRAVKSEANYNASLYDNQAKLIDQQKSIEYGQYQRFKGDTMSKQTAKIAGMGIGLGGSAMAVMLDAQTQINIDQAIGQFNLEQEKQYAKNTAGAYRRAGKRAVSDGYTNAFSSLLTGASNYALYRGGLDLNQGAKGAGKL